MTENGDSLSRPVVRAMLRSPLLRVLVITALTLGGVEAFIQLTREDDRVSAPSSELPYQAQAVGLPGSAGPQPANMTKAEAEIMKDLRCDSGHVDVSAVFDSVAGYPTGFTTVEEVFADLVRRSPGTLITEAEFIPVGRGEDFYAVVDGVVKARYIVTKTGDGAGLGGYYACGEIFRPRGVPAAK